MGKIRAVKLGDEDQEKEAKRKADARRQTKQAKKGKVEGVGMKGGERTSIVEGTDIKPEYKKLVDEVESGETAKDKKDKKKAKSDKVKVHTHSKKYLEVRGMVDKSKLYPLSEAIPLVKKTSITKFDGTVEMHINLNPMTLGEKKDLRGSVNLPHGTGKQIKVVVADEKIIAEVAEGKINFDILVAHPSLMPKLAKVAKILGPKGLMPNPKTGTVTEDVDKRVKELSSGKVNFKTEPNNPIIHMAVGKISFADKQINENIKAVLDAVGHGKISRVTLASTMGPGVKIQLN
jgi:large subunit ribosomal protein L1